MQGISGGNGGGRSNQPNRPEKNQPDKPDKSKSDKPDNKNICPKGDKPYNPKI
ncbi:hypothetical protein Sarmat_00296 [Rickettsiales endosymbiont of Paramecium tredecaurelia]|uniref:hypothetical protein n=1 Tax=Candidatus Sarmatiella mevalonica TaxID=2770581 RepID=UPI001923D369|nr:hypothetical protein [Candidatus Sarmatiella mevalonica]MBL3284451.1 hypothetical protein [Candidatus Sarmatiella mevalonica]